MVRDTVESRTHCPQCFRCKKTRLLCSRKRKGDAPEMVRFKNRKPEARDFLFIHCNYILLYPNWFSFSKWYFLCEIISEEPCCWQLIDERAVHNTVKNVVARTHGDFGLACCSIAFSVKYLNAYTGIALLCCRKDFYHLLWSSLPFITHLENRNQRCPCSFHTLLVGATIRTCQKFLVQYNRDQLLLLLRNCTNEADRQAIQKSLQSCMLLGEEEFQSRAEDSEDSIEMA